MEFANKLRQFKVDLCVIRRSSLCFDVEFNSAHLRQNGFVYEYFRAFSYIILTIKRFDFKFRLSTSGKTPNLQKEK